MTRADVDIAVEWAAEEGWNPGIHDAECHSAVDPKGWFIAKKGDVPVGTAAITNYDDSFSFGGFSSSVPGIAGMESGALSPGSL